MTNTPEVMILTWGFGAIGSDAPSSLDTAMTSGTVFILAKCLNPNNCKFTLSRHGIYFSLFISEFLAQEKRQTIIDKCMTYPDCQSCVSAPYYCGWCSVNVLYNKYLLYLILSSYSNHSFVR